MNIVIPSQFVYCYRDDRYKSGFKIVDLSTCLLIDEVIPSFLYCPGDNDWCIQLYSTNKGFIDTLYGIRDCGYYKEYKQPIEDIKTLDDMEHTIMTTYCSNMTMQEEIFTDYCNQYKDNKITPETYYEFFRKFFYTC